MSSSSTAKVWIIISSNSKISPNYSSINIESLNEIDTNNLFLSLHPNFQEDIKKLLRYLPLDNPKDEYTKHKFF